MHEHVELATNVFSPLFICMSWQIGQDDVYQTPNGVRLPRISYRRRAHRKSTTYVPFY